jgi:hypothetical protein
MYMDQYYFALGQWLFFKVKMDLHRGNDSLQ